MIILGIDPGYGRTGYGVVSSGPRPACVEFGCIETPTKDPFADRLASLHRQLYSLLERVAPDVVAVEKLFFTKNVTTGIEVGHARGVILLTASLRAIPVREFTPSQIKQATTGYGKADKRQMKKMIQLLLGLSHEPTSDDAADALAVALCATSLSH